MSVRVFEIYDGTSSPVIVSVDKTISSDIIKDIKNEYYEKTTFDDDGNSPPVKETISKDDITSGKTKKSNEESTKNKGTNVNSDGSRASSDSDKGINKKDRGFTSSSNTYKTLTQLIDLHGNVMTNDVILNRKQLKIVVQVRINDVLTWCMLMDRVSTYVSPVRLKQIYASDSKTATAIYEAMSRHTIKDICDPNHVLFDTQFPTINADYTKKFKKLVNVVDPNNMKGVVDPKNTKKQETTPSIPFISQSQCNAKRKTLNLLTDVATEIRDRFSEWSTNAEITMEGIKKDFEKFGDGYVLKMGSNICTKAMELGYRKRLGNEDIPSDPLIQSLNKLLPENVIESLFEESIVKELNALGNDGSTINQMNLTKIYEEAYTLFIYGEFNEIRNLYSWPEDLKFERFILTYEKHSDSNNVEIDFINDVMSDPSISSIYHKIVVYETLTKKNTTQGSTNPFSLGAAINYKTDSSIQSETTTKFKAKIKEKLYNVYYDRFGKDSNLFTEFIKDISAIDKKYNAKRNFTLPATEYVDGLDQDVYSDKYIKFRFKSVMNKQQTFENIIESFSIENEPDSHPFKVLTRTLNEMKRQWGNVPIKILISRVYKDILSKIRNVLTDLRAKYANEVDKFNGILSYVWAKTYINTVNDIIDDKDTDTLLAKELESIKKLEHIMTNADPDHVHIDWNEKRKTVEILKNYGVELADRKKNIRSDVDNSIPVVIHPIDVAKYYLLSIDETLKTELKNSAVEYNRWLAERITVDKAKELLKTKIEDQVAEIKKITLSKTQKSMDLFKEEYNKWRMKVTDEIQVYVTALKAATIYSAYEGMIREKNDLEHTPLNNTDDPRNLLHPIYMGCAAVYLGAQQLLRIIAMGWDCTSLMSFDKWEEALKDEIFTEARQGKGDNWIFAKLSPDEVNNMIDKTIKDIAPDLSGIVEKHRTFISFKADDPTKVGTLIEWLKGLHTFLKKEKSVESGSKQLVITMGNHSFKLAIEHVLSNPLIRKCREYTTYDQGNKTSRVVEFINILLDSMKDNNSTKDIREIVKEHVQRTDTLKTSKLKEIEFEKEFLQFLNAYSLVEDGVLQVERLSGVILGSIGICNIDPDFASDREVDTLFKTILKNHKTELSPDRIGYPINHRYWESDEIVSTRKSLNRIKYKKVLGEIAADIDHPPLKSMWESRIGFSSNWFPSTDEYTNSVKPLIMLHWKITCDIIGIEYNSNRKDTLIYLKDVLTILDLFTSRNPVRTEFTLTKFVIDWLNIRGKSRVKYICKWYTHLICIFWSEFKKSAYTILGRIPIEKSGYPANAFIEQHLTTKYRRAWNYTGKDGDKYAPNIIRVDARSPTMEGKRTNIIFDIGGFSSRWSLLGVSFVREYTNPIVSLTESNMRDLEYTNLAGIFRIDITDDSYEMINVDKSITGFTALSIENNVVLDDIILKGTLKLIPYVTDPGTSKLYGSKVDLLRIKTLPKANQRLTRWYDDDNTMYIVTYDEYATFTLTNITVKLRLTTNRCWYGCVRDFYTMLSPSSKILSSTSEYSSKNLNPSSQTLSLSIDSLENELTRFLTGDIDNTFGFPFILYISPKNKSR